MTAAVGSRSEAKTAKTDSSGLVRPWTACNSLRSNPQRHKRTLRVHHPVEDTRVPPTVEVVLDGRDPKSPSLGRKAVRKCPPLATGCQLVLDCVEDLPEIPLSRPSQPALSGNQWFDKFPLCSGKVTLMSSHPPQAPSQTPCTPSAPHGRRQKNTPTRGRGCRWSLRLVTAQRTMGLLPSSTQSWDRDAHVAAPPPRCRITRGQ